MSTKFAIRFILMITMVLPIYSFAQSSSGIVKGKIVDIETQTPLEYATITIYSQKDSLIITGDISDDKGAFFIEVSPGKHFAKIEFIGFQSQFISDVLINRENKVADL